MSTVACHHCGNENTPEANFCSSCGMSLRRTESSMVDAKTEVHSAITPVEGSSPTVGGKVGTISITRGSNAGSRFVMRDVETAIGRHPESEIFLDDVTVSRRHAVIRLDDDTFSVEDVNSLNGTYVNGNRIESKELIAGDQLQVGKYLMLFDLEVE